MKKMLAEIATAGGGAYVRANNTDVGLNSLFNEIGKLEKSEINSRQFSEYNDQFPLFLSLALALIILDFLILDRRNKLFRNFRLFKN
jgi:Ca-activated chloride channel family protein